MCEPFKEPHKKYLYLKHLNIAAFYSFIASILLFLYPLFPSNYQPLIKSYLFSKQDVFKVTSSPLHLHFQRTTYAVFLVDTLRNFLM